MLCGFEEAAAGSIRCDAGLHLHGVASYPSSKIKEEGGALLRAGSEQPCHACTHPYTHLLLLLHLYTYLTERNGTERKGIEYTHQVSVTRAEAVSDIKAAYCVERFVVDPIHRHPSSKTRKKRLPIGSQDRRKKNMDGWMRLQVHCTTYCRLTTTYRRPSSNLNYSRNGN